MFDRSRKFPWAALLLAACSCSVSSAQAATKTIGIDARTEATGKANILGTGSNFSQFRQAIIEDGYSFVALHSFGPSDLAGLDGLILASPGHYPNLISGYSYTTTELAAIHAFSSRAVIIGDTTQWHNPFASYDFYNITSLDNRRLLDNCLGFITEQPGILMALDADHGLDFANLQSLVAPYGVSFENQVYYTGNVVLSDLRPNPITQGVTAVGINEYIGFAQVNPPATALVSDSSLPDVLAVVPEPASLAMLTIGIVMLVLFWRGASTRRPDTTATRS